METTECSINFLWFKIFLLSISKQIDLQIHIGAELLSQKNVIFVKMLVIMIGIIQKQIKLVQIGEASFA